MKKLIIVQTVAPDYRLVFFNAITDALKNNFELYSGDYYFQKSIKSSDKIRRRKIKNRFLFGRKILYQFGLLHLLNSNDVIVLEMNPRIISNWILLIFRKITRKETVLWGHAWPRNGEDSKTSWVRSLMRKLGSTIIVYTNRQREELIKEMPNARIIAAPNAVISIKDMNANLEDSVIQNIIYVGRLVPDKKPFLLLKSFHSILDKLPSKARLLIVGEGEEKTKMEHYIEENKLRHRVLLKGHISDYEILRGLYSSSLLSVSPGYLGLSAIQSFGFGVPILVSRDENHSPEIEALKELNSTFFETDNIDSCGIEILKYFKNKKEWVSTREKIVEHCKRNYSAENMALTFIKLVK